MISVILLTWGGSALRFILDRDRMDASCPVVIRLVWSEVKRGRCTIRLCTVATWIHYGDSGGEQTMVSILKGKKRARLLALVAAVAFLLSGAVSFIQPVTAYAYSAVLKTGKVGESYRADLWKPNSEQYNESDYTYQIESVTGLPDGINYSTNYDSHDRSYVINFRGTPTKAGTFTVEVKSKLLPNSGGSEKQCNNTYTIKIEEADKEEKKDDDDDDSSSSSVNEEVRQAEAAKHFAPDTATMTPEQSAGWSVVSREAPSVSSSSGGVTATSAYQGPVCRLGFQLAAPGYSVGHTYNMSFTGADGSTSMKVPADLVKSGRKFVISFVYGGGVYVSTPVLTPDANGNISFNPALLGLGPNSNAAIAIMYQD